MLAVVHGQLSLFVGGCLCLWVVVFVCGHLLLLVDVHLCGQWSSFMGGGGIGVVWCWAVGGWWWWVLVAICVAVLLACCVVISACCCHACVIAHACGVRWA